MSWYPQAIEGVIPYHASILIKTVGVITSVYPSDFPFCLSHLLVKPAHIFWPASRKSVGPVAPNHRPSSVNRDGIPWVVGIIFVLSLYSGSNMYLFAASTRHNKGLISTDNKVLDQFAKNLSSILAYFSVQSSQLVQSDLICIIPP